MLKQLADAYPQVEQTFAEASAALGLDLWQLVQEGPAEELNRTHNTQPAMLAAGVAVWRVWEARGGPKPVALAGHSLGEYSALVCARALDFGDAVKLVAERGRLMQEAVPAGEGAMAAVLGLEDDRVREVCARAAEGQVVDAVNFNSPGQVVIAGARPAVERAIDLAKAAGSKRALLLPVSVPSHCALMKPAAERLLERLTQAKLRSPDLPVLHNVTVTESRDPKEMRDLLTRQLYRPVRWVETVAELQRRGARSLVEMGPGKVLSGLNRRIDKRIESLAVFDPDSLDKALEALANA
jgi:[acyl-carrier-protein] S-malonyltransferase